MGRLVTFIGQLNGKETTMRCEIWILAGTRFRFLEIYFGGAWGREDADAFFRSSAELRHWRRQSAVASHQSPVTGSVSGAVTRA